MLFLLLKPHLSLPSAPCYFPGALVLQGRDLLGPGDAKNVWEGLGYQVGIQRFEIIVTSPAHNLRLYNADAPNGAEVRTPGITPAPGVIHFQSRKWIPNGQIAIEFGINVPPHLLPPLNGTYQYQVAANVTIAIINKDLGKGPIYMYRKSGPVVLEIARANSVKGWPWTPPQLDLAPQRA